MVDITDLIPGAKPAQPPAPAPAPIQPPGQPVQPIMPRVTPPPATAQPAPSAATGSDATDSWSNLLPWGEHPAARPGPQTTWDWLTKTYNPSPTDYATAFGQGATYGLGPQAVRGLQKLGLPTAGMTPEELQNMEAEATNRLGPMAPVVKGAGYVMSPITKLGVGPLGTLVGAGASKLVAPAIEAAAPYVAKVAPSLADADAPGVAGWLARYGRQLPSSVPSAATQAAATSAISGYGNAPSLSDYKAPLTSAASALENPITYGSGLIPGGQRVFPSQARTDAEQAMRDTMYGGLGTNRAVKEAVDQARTDVSGKGASSGVDYTAAEKANALVENLHYGLPTTAKDIQNVRDALGDIASKTDSSIERKVANAYSTRLGAVLDKAQPVSGGNAAQVNAARQIGQITDQPMTAPPASEFPSLSTQLGLPAGAISGAAMHYLYPDYRVSVPFGVAATAAPYAKAGAQKWWNAASNLNAIQPEYNALNMRERVSPSLGNALLNLMLSRNVQ